MGNVGHPYDNVRIDLDWLHENKMISDPNQSVGQKRVQNTPVRCSRCRSEQNQVFLEFGRFNTSVSMTVKCKQCECIYGLCLQDQCGHTITSEDPENDVCIRCSVSGSVFPEGKEPKRPILDATDKTEIITESILVQDPQELQEPEQDPYIEDKELNRVGPESDDSDEDESGEIATKKRGRPSKIG